jgi:hypothetical protein
VADQPRATDLKKRKRTGRRKRRMRTRRTHFRAKE